MQRPRRTAEFVDDAAQPIKRLSRQQRSLVTASPAPAKKYATPGTAKKYATRQSRIAVRMSSSDRGSNANIQALPLSQSNSIRKKSPSNVGLARTPQRTALFKSPGTAAKVVGTAEKYRGLQNDKRWVQDQVVRISDYLGQEVACGALSGFTKEFFNCRSGSGGLRQMSVKQFVAIINYFLHFACGNRFTISLSNYVPEIVNVLQKLEYPHQLNKSWLKVPTVSHSFGNVMLLFDFFMDFVPTPEYADDGTAQIVPNYNEFQLAPPSEYTAIRLEDESLIFIPDIEFQMELLRHAEKAFAFWDKQMKSEYQDMQQITCDLFVAKRCNVENLSALKASIEQLKDKLKMLEQQRPLLCKEDEQHCNDLKEKLKTKSNAKRKAEDAVQKNEHQLKLLKAELPNAKKKVGNLKSDVDAMQNAIAKQLLNVEQRDALINEVLDNKNLLQSKERELKSLQDFSHLQQIKESRTRNNLMEQIQKYNNHVREVTSQLNTNCSADNLQLTIKLNFKDVQRVMHILSELKKHAEHNLKTNQEALHRLEQQIAQLTNEIDYSLSRNTQTLNRKLCAAKEQLQQYKEFVAKEFNEMERKEERLIHDLLRSKRQLDEMETKLAEKTRIIENMAQENEQIMCRAEKNYYECAKERETVLDEFEKLLELKVNDIQELTTIVNRNDELLKQMKKP